MRQDRLKGIFGGSRALLDAPWGDFQGHFSAENASDATNPVLTLMPHALAAEVAFCITSDEASSCSIQAAHSPLTQSKKKQLQMHHQAAAAKR